MNSLFCLRKFTQSSSVSVPRSVPRSVPHSVQYVVSKYFYSEQVMDHFNKPKNIGTFAKEDKNVGTGLVGSAACGDLIKLQIKVDETTDTIVDAKMKVFGCGSAVASTSYATELIKGMTLDQALEVKNQEIASSLSLIPVKMHCSMLAADGIKQAVQDYRKRKTQRETQSYTQTPKVIQL